MKNRYQTNHRQRATTVPLEAQRGLRKSAPASNLPAALGPNETPGKSVDPRDSSDPLVRRALAIWDLTWSSHDEALTQASKLRDEISETGNHQAYGWATVTCGAIAAYRHQALSAEALLSEALGRFFLVEDAYGKGIATSHLAIPQSLRTNSDRCFQLASEPLRSSSLYSPRDLALMHGIAASCYSEFGNFSAAIVHLNDEYRILKQVGQTERIAVVTANIGSLLYSSGEFDLSITVLSQAWSLVGRLGQQKSTLALNIMANTLAASCVLGRTKEATQYADWLMSEVRSRDDSAIVGAVFESLAMYCARSNQTPQAHYYFKLAERATAAESSPRKSLMLLATTGAIISEATDRPLDAIRQAEKLFQDSIEIHMTGGAKRCAAATLGRCYERLGDSARAAYWIQYEKEVCRGNLIGSLLLEPLRNTLCAREPTVKLTEQELKCLQLSASGQTSSDIGVKLGITPRTVNFHFSKILRKLNAMNRQEAIAKAASANLLR